jgi:hypothetical protein
MPNVAALKHKHLHKPVIVLWRSTTKLLTASNSVHAATGRHGQALSQYVLATQLITLFKYSCSLSYLHREAPLPVVSSLVLFRAL